MEGQGYQVSTKPWARSAQGTRVNPAAKLLLLTRAFETLGCNVVELRTHWHNHQSRAAIARLGAKQDGVLRNHQVWKDGSLRDTVVFSIIAAVRAAQGQWYTYPMAIKFVS